MTIADAAEQALSILGKPCRINQIYTYIIENRLYEFGAVDPKNVLARQIMRGCVGTGLPDASRKKKFYKDGPGCYGLIDWLSAEEQSQEAEQEQFLREEIIEDLYCEPRGELLNTSLFLEKEWHSWLFKNLKENGLIGLGFGNLSVYDANKQNDLNFGRFRTDEVGEIDLLLKTENGNLLVVELKREGTDETIGQICRYVGWVQENLANEGQKIFGIIIAQKIDAKLRYAIKMVKDQIFFQQLIMKMEFGESSRAQMLLE